MLASESLDMGGVDSSSDNQMHNIPGSGIKNGREEIEGGVASHHVNFGRKK